MQEFGIFVELENGIEGLVRLDSLPMDEYEYDDTAMSLHGHNHHYTIGDQVNIIVAGTNVRLRQIDFDLAGVEKSNYVRVIKKSKKEEKKIKGSKRISHSKNSNRGKKKRR